MNSAGTLLQSIAFGRFRVFPHRRELLADAEPIKLGGRAFDLLMALVEAPGAVLTKDDLLARVWPDRVVAENNLHTQILALRQALGEERDLIRTVSGRGYQFTGEIHIVSAVPDNRVSAGLPADAAATDLMQPVSELIGAAHAASFAMSFFRALKMSHFEPEQLDSRSEVVIDKDGDNFTITLVNLSVVAKIPASTKPHANPTR